MGWYILLGFLSAFGALGILWCLAGWLLAAGPQGWVLCPASAEQPGFVPVYLWLRSLGLIRCPLIVMDQGLTDIQRRAYLTQGLRVYSPAEQDRA